MSQIATTQIKNEMIRVRIDAKLKETTAKILNKLGMNYSEAISLFLRQVKLRKGLPFDVKIPNKETLSAIEETRDISNLKSYNTVDEMFEDAKNW